MLSAGNVLSAPHANQGRTRFEGWRRSALRRGTRPHVASTARAVSPSVERGKDDAQATDPTSGERATSNEMESGPEPLHARKALTCGPRAAPEYGARAVHYLPRGAGGVARRYRLPIGNRSFPTAQRTRQQELVLPAGSTDKKVETPVRSEFREPSSDRSKPIGGGG